MNQPVFRFAPSPNGELHLGHALSACLNHDMARAANGRLLLRIEDIDVARCTLQFEDAIYADLSWLGLKWEHPVRRQSDHFDDYQSALDALIDAGLVYPAFMSRGDIRAFIAEWEADGGIWPRDPDGAAIYPGRERTLSQAARAQAIASGDPFAWRLDMAAALNHCARALNWEETGTGPDGETGRISADPSIWGDVILARKDIPASYHLSVCVDDALQGVTHVVRGRDLFHATAIHRLLQELLGFAPPLYHHHDLILDDDGRKLSKSRKDTALAALRNAGVTPADIRKMIGLKQNR